jgi:hypothetical protein
MNMRWGISIVAVALAVAARAEAIEMFTNFHNGENIGFPPMQVPYSVYGGIGHGGWNPHATGMRMPPDPFPAVPAMTPTGQYPAGRWFDYYGAASSHPVGMNGKVEQEQLVSDRRHGRWQRGGSSSESELNQSNDNTSRRADTPGAAGQGEPKAAAPTPATVLEVKSPTAEFLSQIQSIEVGRNKTGDANAAAGGNDGGR